MTTGMLDPGARSTNFWRTPRVGTDWYTHYWDTADRADRLALVGAVRELMPIESVLEVGAHCGPVRRALHQAFPALRYVGLDINAGAVTAGQAYAVGTTSLFIQGSIPGDLAALPTAGWDVVIASVTIACVAPEYVRPTLAHLLRIACHALLFVEVEDAEIQTSVIEWHHDYQQALLALWSPGWMFTRTVLDSDGLTRGTALWQCRWLGGDR